ncbi:MULTISPECIES: hypothetical protein [Methanolobus]|uniref:Uncharacterized protein n=2 Tax=Methanolobus TaxID=2220 RepID=W9DR49_METTI|nr:MULTISPECIES: hypothetical protein [Methanolobus]ETA67960.1 hypothetical protein MettiDRAFT_1401 [Methanolobus tindarius DSM 2278]SFM50254.1 hypothetical protein SAMN04488696_1512 [Methanolobus profundi]
MKTSIIAKIGISMLVMLIAVGTASASGGGSYATAEEIEVADGDFEMIRGTYSADDWYVFEEVGNGDTIYVDIQESFTDAGGFLDLHDDGQGDIEIHLPNSNDDQETSVTSDPLPRIYVEAGTQFSYKYLVARNSPLF